MLHRRNSYVDSFKFALEMHASLGFAVVIDADKCPRGEQQQRFNAPICIEVAVVMSDTQHGNLDIVLRRETIDCK
ncbi:unnamed protein product [Dibothriocephalus latus]|uniref:Uncharacterized protein n=1 Tax=Dibothriocephalus latus TaxID=60516 RepID=A0A3P7NGS4_DIBLA|nr:unnamed protein product [Dibothriocephalus latus]